MNNNPDKEVMAQIQQEEVAEKSLKELISQRHALDEKINEIYKKEKSKALARAKALVEEYGLKQEEIFDAVGPRSTNMQGEKSKVSPKFRNSETGQTWAGRGKQPKWLEGKDREAFRIPEETASSVVNTPTVD